MAFFIRFGSICFSEHFKVAAAFFIKQPCYFFSRKIFKESGKKTRTFILICTIKENSIIAFYHVFMVAVYAYTLQLLFFTDET